MQTRYEKAGGKFEEDIADKFSNLSQSNYDYTSHTFSKGVVCSYNNLLRYDYVVLESKFIGIKQLRKKTVLLLDDIMVPHIDRYKVYSEQPLPDLKIKIKEVCYDLDQIFKKPTKEIRRGINLLSRTDIKIRDYKQIDDFKTVYDIYDDWVNHKNNDPKVFRISFSPSRYLNTFYLKENLPDIYHKIIYVKNQPYASIVFYLHETKPIAYELSFVSRFWSEEMKVINDLNFCIIIWCFHDLWKNYGVRTLNVGTDAGIRGLKVFKNKIDHFYNVVYSN